MAWQASADAGGQLMASLDPDRTGTLSLCGKTIGTAACTDTITPPPGSQLVTAGSAQAASKGGGAMAGINLIVLMLLAGLKLFITRSASQD
jgi:hypothetical protein